MSSVGKLSCFIEFQRKKETKQPSEVVSKCANAEVVVIYKKESHANENNRKEINLLEINKHLLRSVAIKYEPAIKLYFVNFQLKPMHRLIFKFSDYPDIFSNNFEHHVNILSIAKIWNRTSELICSI